MKIETTLEEMRRQAAIAAAEGAGVSYGCGTWTDYRDGSYSETCGDWGEVWDYADGYTLDDVAEVLGSVNGFSDSLEGHDRSCWNGPWVAVLRLNDGRYAYLSAACDYTGWGCREDGHSDTNASLEALMAGAATDDDRARLGWG